MVISGRSSVGAREFEREDRARNVEWSFERREMAAVRKLLERAEVEITLLGERSWVLAFMRLDDDCRWNLDERMRTRITLVAVRPEARADRAGDPVEHHRCQQVVGPERSESVAVAPLRELLANPRQQSGW